MNFHDQEAEDSAQRALNEHKREELTEKYGGEFHSREDSDLPPEVEGEWLNYIDEFERQYENAERITVRKFIGSPDIRALSDIPASEIETELERVLDLLGEHEVVVDFLYDVDVAEAYRFITEELLDEETDDIRIPGMRHCFIYEEFHPNDVEDIKEWARDFLNTFFENEKEWLAGTFYNEGLFDAAAQPISKDRLLQQMAEFHARHASITKFSITPLTAAVDGDQAQVEFELCWENAPDSSAGTVTTNTRTAIHLHRCEYGGWDIVQVELPE